MPIVLISGSINLLEPSGPVQVYNGIALPLHFTIYSFTCFYTPTHAAVMEGKNESLPTIPEHDIKYFFSEKF
jgi:hypothetical protein